MAGNMQALVVASLQKILMNTPTDYWLAVHLMNLLPQDLVKAVSWAKRSLLLICALIAGVRRSAQKGDPEAQHSRHAQPHRAGAVHLQAYSDPPGHCYHQAAGGLTRA